MASNQLRERGKSYRKWVAIRKLTQFIAFCAFVVLFLAIPTAVNDLPSVLIWIDPLAMLANLLSSRVFLLGSLLAFVMLLISVVVGRGWCGWICPLGTILDWTHITKAGARSKNLPGKLRLGKYILLIIILTAALLGNLTLIVLDPLTLLYRSFAVSVLPLFNRMLISLESLLYQFDFLRDGISIFDQQLRTVILPSEALSHRNALLFGVVLIGVISLNWFAPRFWCRYLCPLGGLLGLFSKIALVRRSVALECKGCGYCEPRCPTGTIDELNGYQSDPSECTLCLDCLDACPTSSNTIASFFGLADWNTYDPSRRAVLLSMGAAFIGVFLLRSNLPRTGSGTFKLRPPGVSEADFSSKCVRCGACLTACPTAAIQTTESGTNVDDLWTPLFVPRIGYCDFSCNSCGQICPVEAIPPLQLDLKRQQVMGQVYIDQNRCIAWAEDTDCIICEEMCPLPEKAITLETREKLAEQGSATSVSVPLVNHQLCIGCGICEYKCPVNGEAAIRVYLPSEIPLI